MNFTPQFLLCSIDLNANLHALPSSLVHHGQRLIPPSTSAAQRFDGNDVAVHDPHDGPHHDSLHSHIAWNHSRPVAVAIASRGIVFCNHSHDSWDLFNDLEHGDSEFLR